jgi:hypothetical protein
VHGSTVVICHLFLGGFVSMLLQNLHRVTHVSAVVPLAAVPRQYLVNLLLKIDKEKTTGL